MSAVRPRPAGDSTPPSRPPTDDERAFAVLLNDARRDPRRYGHGVGLNLSAYPPACPLVLDPRLCEAARRHAAGMARSGDVGHVDGGGRDPGRMIAEAGFRWFAWGQSIAWGYPSPAEALRALVVDAGVPGRSHRAHVLGSGEYAWHTHVGVGFALAGAAVAVVVNTAAGTDHADPEPAGRWVRPAFAALGLAAGRGDVSHWGSIARLHGTRAAADRSARTPEAATAVARFWFGVILGRLPTPAETDLWRHAAGGGVDETDLVCRLLAGAEFAGRFGDDADAWARAALAVVCGATNAQIAAAVARLADTAGRPVAARAAALRPEARARFAAAVAAAAGAEIPAEDLPSLLAAGGYSAIRAAAVTAG